MIDPDYIIIIELNDVTEGDVTSVAQDIYDNHAADLDAPDDFAVQVKRVINGRTFDVDWEPNA